MHMTAHHNTPDRRCAVCVDTCATAPCTPFVPPFPHYTASLLVGTQLQAAQHQAHHCPSNRVAGCMLQMRLKTSICICIRCRDVDASLIEMNPFTLLADGSAESATSSSSSANTTAALPLDIRLELDDTGRFRCEGCGLAPLHAHLITIHLYPTRSGTYGSHKSRINTELMTLLHYEMLSPDTWPEDVRTPTKHHMLQCCCAAAVTSMPCVKYSLC